MSTAHIIDAYRQERSIEARIERCQERLRGLDAVVYRVGTHLTEWARSHRAPLSRDELRRRREWVDARARRELDALRLGSGVARVF